ncbi:hypothetical protein F5Y06DRAFT_305750 [Hypoxylon sp. FL0890]|nr:hypothetical protein F5Y06DRAFT_305750 [Hypoxylon sp. FL0890]
MGILRRAALFSVALLQPGVLGESQTRTPEAKTTTSSSATITGVPFEGFIVADTTIIPVSCSNGEVFTTSSSFAACCATTTSSCAFATACKDNAVVFEDGASSNCGPLQCHSRKIFSTYGAGDPAFIEAACASSGQIDILYRAVTMTSKLVLPLVAADSTIAVVTADGAPTATAPGAPTNTGDNSSNGSSSNTNVIILASVLGGVTALSLIIFAFWYGRKRGAAEKMAEAKAVYEMKIFSQIGTSTSLPSGGAGAVSNWEPSNLSGPLALSYSHNRSQQ